MIAAPILHSDKFNTTLFCIFLITLTHSQKMCTTKYKQGWKVETNRKLHKILTK